MLQVEEGEPRAPLPEKAVNPVAVEAARQQLQLPQVLQPYDRVLKGIQIISVGVFYYLCFFLLLCAKRFIDNQLVLFWFYFGFISTGINKGLNR